ncbi:MAG: single-stranded DNA-binding protein [Parcubacteria group bacterium]|nr:single-stranded DNA-binding protein [Parcubacteria group bacterium]
MNLNKIFIIGNLTRNPEKRTTPQGQTVVSFGVATNKIWTDQQGQKQQKTEFHNVVAWRRLGDIVAQYLKKGSMIFVEGRLETRSWEDKEGIKRYRTDIIAENIQMGPKSANAIVKPSGQEEYNVGSEPIIDSQAADEEFSSVKSGDEIEVKEIPF